MSCKMVWLDKPLKKLFIELDLAKVVSFDRALNGKVRRFVAYSAHSPSCESPSNCTVFSKETKNIFSLNRNEPALNLFRLFFGLFHETKNILRFFLCFEPVSNRNKHKSFETNRKNPLKTVHCRCITAFYAQVQHKGPGT
jgi:hypothetical protein